MRKRSSYLRKSETKQARLIFIATEGEKTEVMYFEALARINARVHVVCLPTVSGKSAPHFVIERLDSIKKESVVENGDELWMVIDRDIRSWTKAHLSEMIMLCKQKKYGLCISNPCFELWLLLHFIDIVSENKQFHQCCLTNLKIGKKTFLEIELARHLSSYNKSNIDFKLFRKHIFQAQENAKRLLEFSEGNLIDNIGTNVQSLIETILVTK